jgi:protein involved in polysaccharide export with SLBB domain
MLRSGATSAVPLLVAAACLLGCADKPTAPYPISSPLTHEDTSLGPGDVFDVRVFGEQDLTGTYQVAVDGTISYPLIGEVVVAGKTPPELEEEIARRLADGFLRRPQVSVLVKEYRSKRVSVFGQVKSPGTFPFSDNMSIVEAISRAGGFTPMARKNNVRITRVSEEGKNERIIVAVDDIGQGKAPNFLLRPGDVVFVPERVF